MSAILEPGHGNFVPLKLTNWYHR